MTDVATIPITKLNEEDLKEIHRTLHSTIDNCVVVQGIVLDIEIASNGCRCIRLPGVTVMEQNKNKGSSYAQRANAGEKLSWIIRTGKWILIYTDPTTNEIKFQV